MRHFSEQSVTHSSWQFVKKTLPFTCQPQSPSPYFDLSLFRYDEKVSSSTIVYGFLQFAYCLHLILWEYMASSIHRNRIAKSTCHFFVKGCPPYNDIPYSFIFLIVIIPYSYKLKRKLLARTICLQQSLNCYIDS